jgi:hypothetical protein
LALLLDFAAQYIAIREGCPTAAPCFELPCSELMLRRSAKASWWAILAVLVMLVAVDRGYWAEVAYWREDQACNLWLGYARSLLTIPVGLISSVGTPNPNGMPLLGAALSRLPNLWAISTALGLLQGILVLWASWLMTGPRLLCFFVVALPALSSVVLRASSIEFWNQWILIDINLAFFALWIAYLRQRSLWTIVGCVGLMLFSPAVYLAGLVNSLLYLGFVLAALWMHPPRIDRQHILGPALATLALAGMAMGIIWLPYRHAMEKLLLPVPTITLEVVKERSLRSLEALLAFPQWSVTHWFHNTDASFMHSNDEVVRPRALSLLDWSKKLLLTQAIVALITLSIAMARWLRRHRPVVEFFVLGRQAWGRAVLAGLVFVMFAAVLCALLAGPNWMAGERPDQQVQFLPFLLFAWFSLPFVLNLPLHAARSLRAVTLLVAAGFCALSLAGGWKMVSSHLSYRGKSLSHADIPLRDQRQAVEFMARDWLAISDEPSIPVSYQLGQEWVIDFGKQLDPWYTAPMTVGRALDFELSRVYGLTNTQEGIQERSTNSPRYIVSYAFKRPSRVPGMNATAHDFGRIRVTILTRTQVEAK